MQSTPLKLNHSFGTLAEPILAQIKPLWETKRPSWRQVHGITCVQVTGPRQECGDTDALWTTVPGLPVGIVTADCVPVLVRAERKEGQPLVAAAHAGWRGVYGQIVPTLFAQIKDYQKVQVWLGPSILACCYQVSEELLAQFQAAHPKLSPNTLAPYGDRRLDLHAVLEHQLLNLGITQIHKSIECTNCTQNSKAPDNTPTYKYHSYRREKVAHRQYSIIWIP